MTSVSRTFTVSAAPATVLDYLADFTNAEEWDPGTQKCTRNDAGPVVVGASWHNVSKIMGTTTELEYTLKTRTDEQIVLVGRNKSATSIDSITVRAADGGSEITYHVDLEMHGAAKLATPAMKLVFEKLANDTEKQMTEVLNRLPA
ncbi:SRPBCC family protein [uncultured Jatrophihabitans sp.]|uniref:SRPBCC family protein n=1 Tax=uncultured Jatrophihabitans sp. TaxID=1610747 RepID=UPI0035CAB04D